MKDSTRSWLQFSIIVFLIVFFSIIILANVNHTDKEGFRGYMEEFEDLLNNINKNTLELHDTLVENKYIEHPTRVELENLIRERCK